MSNSEEDTEDFLEDEEPKVSKKSSGGKSAKNAYRCNSCGYIINPKETPPNKTWNMISPMPDKMGRVTLTIMGSFTCPKCSKNVKLAMQKIKSADDIDGKSKKDNLLTIINGLKEKTSLETIAKNLGMQQPAVGKAIKLLIQRGEVKGTMDGNIFIPDMAH